MDVLKSISTVPVDINERPRIPITIIACGIDEDHKVDIKPKLTAV